MRIALIQLAYDDAETLDARVERVAALVRSQAGHDLVVLPELWGAGGFAYREWDARAQDVEGSIGAALSSAARDAGVFLHGGSLVERPSSGERGEEGHDLWNTSVVYDANGTLVATYRKIHRFGFGAGEPTLMDAGTDLVRIDVPAGSSSLAVGLSTCYDIRFPEMYRLLLDRGAEAFVVPAAWPMARVEAWRLLLRARAVENQCFVLACNTAGTHANAQMGGHSAVIAPDGEVLGEAGDGQQVLSVEIDPGRVGEVRQAFPVLADRRL